MGKQQTKNDLFICMESSRISSWEFSLKNGFRNLIEFAYVRLNVCVDEYFPLDVCVFVNSEGF